MKGRDRDGGGDSYTIGHGVLCFVSVHRQNLQAENPSSIDSDAAPSSPPSTPCSFRTPRLSPRDHHPIAGPFFHMPHGIGWGGTALTLFDLFAVQGVYEWLS